MKKAKTKSLKKQIIGNTMAVIGFIVFASFVISCDGPIGLGERLDIKGPMLTITAPTPEDNQKDVQVGNYFELKGITTGESPAERMEIQLTRYDRSTQKNVTVGREWRYNNGWQWKKDGDASWQTYTEADYDSMNFSSPVWCISGNTVEWGLPINLLGFPKGDFFFTVQVWNQGGYTDSSSIQKIKVIYDNDNPELIITRMSDLLFLGSNSDSALPGLPEDMDGKIIFDTYTYDPINDPDGTNAFINQWVSRSLEFGWEIDKDLIGVYSLTIEITNQHNLSTGAGKILYYRYEYEGNDLPRRGIFTDGTVPGGYQKVGGGIPVSELAPRDLTTGQITGSLSSNGYTPMQIVVRLKSDISVHDPQPHKGYFACRPEADKPWAHIAFGSKEDPGKDKSDINPDRYYMWSGTENRLSFAYDNTGLASLSWKLYRVNGDLVTASDGAPGSQNAPWEKTVTFNSPDKKQSWDFTADADYGFGYFKIVVKAKDVNQKEGEGYIAYFSIESNTTPTIKKLFSPSETETLFGDARGDFTISGAVQIEDPAGANGNSAGVDRVDIVWINLQNDNDTYLKNALKYQDRNYEGWDKAASSGYYQDAAGNRVWKVKNIVFQSGTNGNSLEEYNFSLDLNIFSDLNIGVGSGKNPLSGQTFLIRVLSIQNNKPKSSVYRFSTLADILPPKMEITKITLFKYNKNNSGYDPIPHTKLGGVFPMIPAINAGDKVKLEGEWSDDSLIHWSSLDAAFKKSLYTDFSVKWESESGERTVPNLNFGIDGKWSTGDIVFDANNLNPIVWLTAGIKDVNDQEGQDRINIILETDNPTMIRVSSETGDGYYGPNKDTFPLTDTKDNFIDIFLDFNKAVKFFKNPDTPPYLPADKPATALPYLELNNGGVAFYFSGNGDTRLIFRYFVDGKNTTFLQSYDAAKAGNGGSSSAGRLNVTNINWNKYSRDDLVSADGGTEVFYSEATVFNPSNPLSLSGGKNIVIDKNAPTVKDIVTTAADVKPYGRGSTIYITVNFNETVQIPLTANQSNFYLELKGVVGAKAVFDNVAGAQSVTFCYEVKQGQNTGVGQFLGVNNIVANIPITDVAGNEYIPAGPPSNGTLNKNLVIDTTPPAAPVIRGVDANKNYYGTDTVFNITNLESQNVTVEYCLNYSSAAGAVNNWISVPSTYNITSGANGLQITGIPIEINGTYNISARQRDDVTEPNVSSPAAVVGPVKVDRGALLTRLGSSTPDGIYGAARQIDIDMVFRIPLYLDVSLPNSSAYFTLKDNIGARATLVSKSADSRTYTFRFTVAEGNRTDRLDVNTFVNGLNFYDGVSGASTRTNVNQWISLNDIAADANGFKLPKSISILTGNPKPKNNSFVVANSLTSAASAAGIRFYQINPANADNGYRLEIEFERDIYRGDNMTDKLRIEQIATDYRIPAVLSEARWSELFLGRSDIPQSAGGSAYFTAAVWRTIGEQLYQKGSNGARVSGNNDLESDTTVKYILKYDIATTTTGTGNVPIKTAITFDNLRNALRIAETLNYLSMDNEVTIVNDSSNRPRILRITLDPKKPFAVKGAKYQWKVPNGFVKDFLEKPNGIGVTGYDNALASGNAGNSADDNAERALKVSGIEVPVIRINKGQVENITYSGDNRQAEQPLQSSVRIDCRTPDTLLRYRTRNTVDNVGRIVMRSKPGDLPNRLPNLGNQIKGDTGSFDAAKRRPQSGNGTTPINYNGAANGLNHWLPMGNWSNSYTDYREPFKIGTTNYNDGGMIYHIHAQATANNWATTYNAYEAAYRSVFVFNNSSVNDNGDKRNLSQGLHENNSGSPFTNRPRTRVYIRGGDSTVGEPSIPDFPIARDKTKKDKARLLTPFDISTDINARLGTSAQNYTNGSITNANIVSNISNNNFAGEYMWFWVTWGVNVYAYVDMFSGEMAANGSHHVAIKDLYGSWLTSKEHYPVIPGRTTVVETRGVYGTQVDGYNQHNILVGNVLQTP